MLGCATTNQHSDVLPKGEIESDRSIDLRGKTITPFIVFYIVKNLNDMQKGEILEVNTDKFEAIENHWRKTPRFKWVICKAVPEVSTRIAMLRNGQADIVPIPTDRLEEIKKLPSPATLEIGKIGGGKK